MTAPAASSPDVLADLTPAEFDTWMRALAGMYGVLDGMASQLARAMAAGIIGERGKQP